MTAASPPRTPVWAARATTHWTERWVARWAGHDLRTRTALTVLGVGAAVFGLGLVAVALTPEGSHAAAWWPAAGVSVGAVMLSTGRLRLKLLATVAAASFLANLAGGHPLMLAVGYAVANTSEAALTGYWLGRAGRPELAKLRDLARLLAAAAAGAALAGGIAGFAVWQVLDLTPWSTWSDVAAAHSTAVLVIVPLFMRRLSYAVPIRRWEPIAQWATALVATATVFAPGQRLPMAFAIFPVLVWTGLRLGARAASTQLLVVGVMATVLTTRGEGPFAQADRTISPGATGALVQVFLLSCALVVLALSVTVAQREAALAGVSASERFLDALVETMDVGVIAVDAAGKVTMFNRMLREIHGDASDDLPRSILEPQQFALYRADGVTPLPPEEVPMTRVLADGEVHGAEIVVAPPGGPARHMLVHGRQIRDAHGTLLGAVTAVHDVTVLKQHESELQVALRALADQREFDEAVVEAVNAGVVACAADGSIVLRNAAQRRVTGIDGRRASAAEALLVPLRMMLEDGSEIELTNSPLRRALAGEDITDLAVRIAPEGLPAHDVLVTARQIHDPDGRLLGAVSAFTDVTAERTVQAQLRESVAFHDALLAASPDLIFITDAHTGANIWSSQNLTTMLGYSEQEVQDMGAAISDLLHPEDTLRYQAANAEACDLADGEALQMRYRVKIKSGSYIWLSRRVTPFTRAADGRVLQVLGIARDVTAAVEVEDRLTEAALHDPLTGLPNRRLLSDRLELALERTARSGGEVAVLFCDLDGFKHVNDVSGHAAGDAVLTRIAARLRAVVRPQDTVARVGGDEFVVIVDPVPTAGPDDLRPGPTTPVTARVAAEAVARRITDTLSEPIEIGGTAHVVTVSIGVTFARAGDDTEQALCDADSAMYQAKARGKDRLEIFDSALRADAVERGRVERILRTAITQPTGTVALSVDYQPIVDLSSQQIIGVEALARLHDTEGVPIEPRTFIPIAEETGMIAALGRVILQTACADLARWHGDHPAWRHLGVSVNLSARQASRADLVATVRETLEHAGLTAELLTLELTESVLLEAGRSALTALQQLRALGVKIDIDDFGTGYASLRYLAQLPVTGVKIDRSFTMGLPDDPTSRTIVRAIAGLARDLDLSCVVEGIETDAQLLALPSGLAGQGYLLGRPVPAAGIDARLAASDRRTPPRMR